MVVDTVSLPSRGPVARENGRLVRANSDSCLQGGQHIYLLWVPGYSCFLLTMCEDLENTRV